MKRTVDMDALRAARRKPKPAVIADESLSLSDQMRKCQSTGAFDRIAKRMDAAEHASPKTLRRWQKARKAATVRLKKKAA